MNRSARSRAARLLAQASAGALLAMLSLPLVALLFSTSFQELQTGLGDPRFLPALLLSLRTTLLSLGLTVVTGLPLAWWLANSSSRWTQLVNTMVGLPIVVPPAVVGVALLQAFGRQGLLGPALSSLGLSIPFTQSAVVIAQLVVSAPFFVQAAESAFRGVDSDLLVVARTLGAGPNRAFLRVAVPLALPGLLAGAAMAWARSLGEFGATLLFAGNLRGTTQTMPLAIYNALESDVRVAVAFSLVLAAAAALLLLLLRANPMSRFGPELNGRDGGGQS